ncbi:MAG: single-stranded DNA-binding protein, partial [Spirochaetia bacterium]|nr:single-stranded DNA-binding protein [Spirochaetia bacterium]
VSVDGSLRFSSWESAEGKKQSKVEIYVENLQFLESSRSAGDNPVESARKGPEVEEAPFNDDIPF